ncbi:MAG: calcium-translocating P-type ATPase, PMCA-type [Synergistaceae bacterium]|nr:calcium-translocating P-type ATPase, PMCA-type [Synergistaceae bacterium]
MKMKEPAPYQESAEETLRRLGTDAREGLNEGQLRRNRELYGVNSFTREKPVSLIRRAAEALREPMMILLLFAAFVTLAVNVARALTGEATDFIECAGIFAAVFLSVTITVVMEGQSAKAFEALNRAAEKDEVRVLREGAVVLVPREGVVVGDIILVETGDKFPADARLIAASSLMADESALTGESMPVLKEADVVLPDEDTPAAERANMIYSGCFAAGGSGRAVVTAVGDATEFGKIAGALSSTEKTSTPLQEKLAKMGGRITILGAAAASLLFFIQLARLANAGEANWENISQAFITAIVLIVAAVPEGLPTIVAASLAINIIRMSRQKALVKKLAACETIGGVDVICSDKTGTLTENRMTVTELFSGGGRRGANELTEGALLDNFALNGTADLRFEDGKREFIGNPTECALLAAAHESGYDYRLLREANRILHSFPFSSDTKNMTTIADRDGHITAYTKGSPEKVISMSDMTPEERAEAEREIAALQGEARRVIAFAHKELKEAGNYEERRGEIESGMKFDGFVAISDPLRPDVFEALEGCRDAGIDVKMLTGDNLVTASAIAKELGMLEEGRLAVEARELEKLSDGELAERLPSIRVIARSTPAIKMRVVKALKALGSVVAVTGDGINDAPALKNADVGIAMGIAGTEVSKEASDIVLLDDSFSTIVRAVRWGRGIYENFQRFIQFQLTVNLSSVLVVLISVIAGFPAPFTALQILWINIIMDGPPGLTLGLEPISGDLMARRPVRRGASIVTRPMMRHIAVNGLYITAAVMAQRLANFLGVTEAQTPTALFTLFVVFQLFNAFNSRETGDAAGRLGGNRLMLAVFALTFALQFLITQYGGRLFDTVPLPAAVWLKILAAGATVLLLPRLIRAARGSSRG